MSTAATAFQRNKRIYVQEEDKLEGIVSDEAFQQKFHQWLDSTIAQLDLQFEACEQQLSELQQSVAVEAGNYWCSKTIIDHCNLHIAEKRIIVAGGIMEHHASLPELVTLISCLQQLKTQTFVTPKQRRFIEQCEAELRTVTFEARELVSITNALQTKLKDDGNTRGVFGDLTVIQNAIDNFSPDIDQCEQLLEASIANGEMGLAEDISRRQLEIYERILALITDQYPIISNYYSDSRDGDRRRRWAIFRMADKDITAVIEGKYRQIEACEEDLLKIKEQIENYNNDDAHQRKRYEADRALSDDFLQKNKEKQQGVWNHVYEIFKELQKCQGELTTLARQRRKEISRRLQMEEHEAGRRSGHESFIKAAADHAQKLQNMINNALAAKDIASALNNFVLDGCDSIAKKYDKQQNALSEMLRLVQQHHFKRFSDYYIAASRYLYRKERRLENVKNEITSNEMKKEILSERLDTNAKSYAVSNNNLLLKHREVAQEIIYFRHKLDDAEKEIEPTLRSLQFAGVEYIHPRDIVDKVNHNRSSTILDYREFMSPSVPYDEKVQVEEMETLSLLRTQLSGESSVRASERVRFPAISGAKSQSVLEKRVSELLEKKHTDAPLLSISTSKSPRLVQQQQQQQQQQGTRNRYVVSASTAAAQTASTDTAATRDAAATTHYSVARSSRMEGTTFRALYSYKARSPDELTFEIGDLIVCVNRAQEEGWFKGVCNQRTGLFPINYVAPHDEE